MSNPSRKKACFVVSLVLLTTSIIIAVLLVGIFYLIDADYNTTPYAIVIAAIGVIGFVILNILGIKGE
jgi:F0F1-type ATP synthase assembly protein I